MGRESMVAHQETVQTEVLAGPSVKWYGRPASCESVCHVEVRADSLLLLALEIGAVTQSMSWGAMLLHDR